MLSNPIKDQTIDGLEEWLKNNKPTIIPRGVSTATGYTPPQPSERTKEESKNHRAEINRLIREQKQAEREAKRQAAIEKARLEKKKISQNLRNEAIKLITDFKSKAGHGDIGRLAQEIGVWPETISSWLSGRVTPSVSKVVQLRGVISVFQYTKKRSDEERLAKRRQREGEKRGQNPETMRRREVSRLKNEALAAGEREFDAPCRNHGMTRYFVHNNKPRCAICEKEKQREKYDAMCPNLKKMKKCLQSGEKFFTGDCKTHGETRFAVYKYAKRQWHQCMTCKSEASKRQRDKRLTTDEQKFRKLNREMALTMYEADPSNRKFKGMCLKHGETDFYIKVEKRLASGISYECRACKLSKRNVKI